MINLLVFVVGAVVGSFLNVLALRLNTGLSINGRSKCSACGRKLGVLELVPILSFLILKGRCSKCKSKISWQYPLVELLTALVFLTIFLLEISFFHKIILETVFAIYIVILIYDARHKIIPDTLSYTAILLSLLVPLVFVDYSLLDWLAAPILFSFFGGIWLLSGGRAMGFGDAKLSVSVALLLGAGTSFSAIILAFWIGAIYGLTLIGSQRVRGLLTPGKNITMKSEVPFAPFIILGAWISLIFNLNLLNV